MNWATIDPNSRLYKGKNLFRWEDSPGLEHHCGICHTPLNNGRAKGSCIGRHVEPCYRFHQQLHFNGKSHECFGCNSSDEMHHNRHKEILRIIRQINSLDEASDSPSRLLSIPKKRRESSTTSSPTDASSETYSSEQKLRKKERKKAKKAGNGAGKDRPIVEAFPREELDFVSEAIHLKIHESKGAWEGTYNYGGEDKDPDIDEEAIEDDEDEVSTEQKDLVDPYSVKATDETTPRQRKIAKIFHTPINHSSFGGGSRKYTPNRGKDADLYDGVDSQIFFRLGIEVFHPRANSKTRKELVAKLVAAVREDLGIMIREEKESTMREAGFWRWAGKTAYDYISKTREDFDWATGQKKGAPRRENFVDDEISIAEGFEDLSISDMSPTTVFNTPAKDRTPVETPKSPTPKAPKKPKISMLPKPKPVKEEDEYENAKEIKIGPTYAMVVKVLGPPAPEPDIGFADDDCLGWETVSRHKKTSSKSSNTLGHKRVSSRHITVR
ncbi:hypothetical protein LSUE1_G005140 [Lachnellula suecica]|uniref:Uncharacterized protein n=1 Tax=Lachnellula suecica TaxID=602035 RepID=A0A8T9C165_9HELO|nr:hypothetical protein LSUE1_G005140 [Lachnellula suecica]